MAQLSSLGGRLQEGRFDAEKCPHPTPRTGILGLNFVIKLMDGWGRQLGLPGAAERDELLRKKGPLLQKPQRCFSLQTGRGPRTKALRWPGFRHPLPKPCHHTAAGPQHSLRSGARVSTCQIQFANQGVALGAKA